MCHALLWFRTPTFTWPYLPIPHHGNGLFLSYFILCNDIMFVLWKSAHHIIKRKHHFQHMGKIHFEALIRACFSLTLSCGWYWSSICVWRICLSRPRKLRFNPISMFALSIKEPSGKALELQKNKCQLVFGRRVLQWRLLIHFVKLVQFSPSAEIYAVLALLFCWVPLVVDPQ